MTDHHEEVANKIMETFKASLDEAVREQISEARLHELATAIQVALSAERMVLAEYLEDVVKKMRAGAERPQIEL
ncbi:MAG: hypothetical protein PVF75_10620 [Granulosicoccaceae bacterium]|jgi:pyridoxine/pyridoxamine 5'-phosphate oxidase